MKNEDCFFRISRVTLLLASVCGWVAFPKTTVADDLADAVRLAKQYVQSEDTEQRNALSETLASFDKDWQRVLTALRARPSQDAKSGYFGAEHFTSSELRQPRPDDLLYFIVPQNYQPERATGLVIFMHGGGKGSPRTSPARYMRPDEPTEAYIGNIFEQTGMIGAAPSAPWNPNDHSRWTLPETDDYIADVITECESRFHIDPDRVFLWGHSMGGFGGFHQVQRQPDRFAAVIASAGSWTLAKWPVVRGTTFCIVHGTNDAEPKIRDRHTDIQFARQAHKRLTDLEIPHVYKEHSGPHPVAHAKKPVLELLQEHADLKRDPFPRQVAVASPVGFRSNKCFPKQHSFWLSLDESVQDSKLEYDALDVPSRGYSKDSLVEDWKQWKLTATKETRSGAFVEAVNSRDNHFDVTTIGVSQFTLWLHPQMVDFSKPITVTVNGTERIEQRVTPTLVTLLESFQRRHDWNLAYPAQLTIQVRNRETAN